MYIFSFQQEQKKSSKLKANTEPNIKKRRKQNYIYI